MTPQPTLHRDLIAICHYLQRKPKTRRDTEIPPRSGVLAELAECRRK